MTTVYNTLGRTRQAFEPLEDGRVRVYVCGPTVQSAPHLGHGRCAVVFDVIRRYLMWRGWDVLYVQNVTDVDDKIIANAARLGVTPEELARDMADRFRTGYRLLNVLDPDMEPTATDHIPEMLAMIRRLIDRGLAYPGGGDVYFRVRRLEGYGKLSGRNVDELRAGARIEPGLDKEDPLDFALWKAAKPGEPAWPSPWGPGRPGWHIECSAMSAKYLGTPFDIHAGGADLIFPHHENEIAQSEGSSGRRFVRYWLHNGMVNLRGEKLSKSTGHVIDLAEAIQQHGGPAVRLFYLQGRLSLATVEFSEELLDEAAAGLDQAACLSPPFGAGPPYRMLGLSSVSLWPWTTTSILPRRWPCCSRRFERVTYAWTGASTPVHWRRRSPRSPMYWESILAEVRVGRSGRVPGRPGGRPTECRNRESRDRAGVAW